MSITGEAQVINTLKSSWEILDSPVPLKSKYSEYSTGQRTNLLPPIANTSSPLRSECSVHSAEIKSKSLLPSSDTFTSIRSECTQDSVEPLQNTTTERATSQTKHKPSTNSAEKAEIPALKSENYVIERIKTDPSISVESTQTNLDILDKASRETTSSGTATYVASQRRPTEDIAETIATEFEQHVRKSRFAKKEPNIEETAHFPHLHNRVITEETENSDLYQEDQEESTLSYSNIKLQADGVYEETNANIRIERSPNSREYSEISRVSIKERHFSGAHQGRVSRNVSSASHNSEASSMSHPYTDGHVYNNRNSNDRGRSRHPPLENERQLETQDRNDQSRGDPPNEDQHHRPLFNDSNSFHSQTSTTHFPERHPDDDSVLADTEQQHDHTSREHHNLTDSGRSRPDGVDHPQVPASTVPDEPFTRQTMQLPSVPPPNFHPPPTIIQNGISQADLLELMSKGLGQFTTEMAVMVIEKLKPEYETLAKQVGAEVKDSTVTELKELREKLTSAETEVEAVKIERDNLRVENSKERDQLKKEFEKDRLKRVKEFEEKKELIENLQKENEQFKGLLKEKDKLLKKTEMKAKSEEQKRIKSEEESEKKLKEMQKELDKSKGELLVQKSKKRLQVTSAQNKKECLGKLNSQHGLYPKQFNGHKPIPYDEGDD